MKDTKEAKQEFTYRHHRRLYIIFVCVHKSWSKGQQVSPRVIKRHQGVPKLTKGGQLMPRGAKGRQGDQGVPRGTKGNQCLLGLSLAKFWWVAVYFTCFHQCIYCLQIDHTKFFNFIVVCISFIS